MRGQAELLSHVEAHARRALLTVAVNHHCGQYGKLRECYENALGRNPNARGRVSIRFVIDHEGKVPSARIEDNTLPDCEAVRCLRGWFGTLRFPPPTGGGHVTVVYPIQFTPGD